MGKPTGFLEIERKLAPKRAVSERVNDYKEIELLNTPEETVAQASRCMDCGTPFCHHGCPLGNIIPEFNDAVYEQNWKYAYEILVSTNNFPEFTGRLCPAPCETACVVGINRDAVTIKQVELRTIEEAFDANNVKPLAPDRLSGKTVAVIGSGPAGLAVAQQLTRAGHTVAVYDRAEKIGGLLRYGIPEFKMEKHILDRRLTQMEQEGTRFRPGVNVGVELTGSDLRAKYDAVVLAVGATQWRDLPIAGRENKGVYQAMEFLPWGNKEALGEIEESPINVAGKHVIILGGGDTGADCLGTSVRQGAASVTQLEIMPRPTEERPSSQPWPTYPMIYRVSSAHEELDNRVFSVSTQEFVGDGKGNLKALKIVETKFENGKFEPVPGTEKELPADFVFLAMGFTGPEKSALIDQLEVKLDDRGNIARDENFQSSEEGIFVAGDAGRGQSLIVWAIAEGRSAAAAVDRYLTGETQLHSPIEPTTRPLMV